MDSQARDVMNVLELCEYLQMSEAKIREMLRQGTIPAVLIGRQWRIRKRAIDRWLEEQEGKHAARTRVQRSLPRLEREVETGNVARDRLDLAIETATPLPPKPPRQPRTVEKADAGTRKPPPAPPLAPEVEAAARRQRAQEVLKQQRVGRGAKGHR
jgi:excisionase family DNA binding protein